MSSVELLAFDPLSDAGTSRFPGVTGEITLDEQRNAQKPAVVLEVRDGQFHFAERIGS